LHVPGDLERNNHPIAGRETGDILANRHDVGHEFVAKAERLAWRQFPSQEQDIGVTNRNRDWANQRIGRRKKFRCGGFSPFELTRAQREELSHDRLPPDG
jgi:hypothetical protein